MQNKTFHELSRAQGEEGEEAGGGRGEKSGEREEGREKRGEETGREMDKLWAFRSLNSAASQPIVEAGPLQPAIRHVDEHIDIASRVACIATLDR